MVSDGRKQLFIKKGFWEIFNKNYRFSSHLTKRENSLNRTQDLLKTTKYLIFNLALDKRPGSPGISIQQGVLPAVAGVSKLYPRTFFRPGGRSELFMNCRW